LFFDNIILSTKKQPFFKPMLTLTYLRPVTQVDINLITLSLPFLCPSHAPSATGAASGNVIIGVCVSPLSLPSPRALDHNLI